MNMDIEESIDQQLANVTSFECDSEKSEIEEMLEFDAEGYEKELTMGGSKWLDLFVERTKEQETKRNEVLNDVNETIQIINRTISNRTFVTNIAIIPSEEESINDDEKDLSDHPGGGEPNEIINPEHVLMMNSSSLLPSTAPLDKEILNNLTNIEEHMNAIQLQVDDRISESQLLDQKFKEELDADVAKQHEIIDASIKCMEDHSFQKQIEDEHKRLQQLQMEIKVAEEVRKKEAAITLQKHVRGYAVRKEHSEKVERKRKEVKTKIFNQRVRDLDNKREKDQEEKLHSEREEQRIKEEKMIKEEQERLEKEQKLREDREKMQKEREERLKIEEEQRIKEEQDNLKQQRIKEEEERIQKEKEEKKIKEEHERLKKEKERRINEEQERIEREQEQKLKEEQDRLKKEKEEEERLRMEKEQQRIKEEEQRLQKEKEEEERLRIEKEKQRIKEKEEEERLRIEKEKQKIKEKEERLQKEKEEKERLRIEKERQRKLEEERLQKEHEEMVKLEEEMAKMEEQMRLKEEQNKSKKNANSASSQAFTENLLKWRENVNKEENLRIEQISRESRRSSSSGYQRARKLSMAARLAPITEKELIQATWPHHREENRTMETLQRIYMQQRGTIMTSQGCLLIGDQRCVSLTHVTVNNCGLEAVEGFENLRKLKHFDVSHNQIKFAELSGMMNVESISLSHNKLSSLHGISTCKNLVYLDLSHNDFSKTPSNLNQLENLLHLRLNSNTLLNVRNSLPVNLITLDLSHNHVTSLEGVQWCVTLNSLRVSDNNLTAIESNILRHLTQLTRLDLSTNSIDNMAVALSETWLPSLTRLNLSTNQIQADDITSSLHERLPNLMRVDVSGNLISDLRPLVTALRSCKRMQEVFAAHNLPLEGEGEEPPFTVLTCLEEDVPGMKREDLMWEELMILGKMWKICGDEEDFEIMLEERLGLEDDEMREMKILRGWGDDELQLPPDHIALHCRYLKDMFRINQQIRDFLEGEKEYDQNVPDDDDVTITSDGDIIGNHDRCDNVTSLDVMLSSSVLELPTIQQAASLPMTSSPATTSGGNDNVKMTSSASMDCSKLGSARKSKSQLRGSNGDDKKSSERQRTNDLGNNRALMTSQHLNNDYHNDVTIIGESSPDKSKHIKKAEVNRNTWGEDELPEVDLSSLEFDEDLFDRQWAVKTDFHENLIMQQQSAEHMMWNSTNETTIITSASPTPRKSPKSQRSSSAATDRSGSSKFMRPPSTKLPLPPILPSPFMNHSRVRTSSRSSSLKGTISTPLDPRGGGERNRSRLSTYEEKMMQEWNTSSELILKRAAKLSGKKQKKANADAKLKRFQQVNKNIPKVIVRNYKEEAQGRRIDYFKAQETRATKAERQKFEDEERRKLFTYEWLKKSEDNFSQLVTTMTEALDDGSEGGDGSHKKSASFLPPILPPSKKNVKEEEEDNDIEILSINSHRSGGSVPAPPKDHLLRDIVRRHHRK